MYPFWFLQITKFSQPNCISRNTYNAVSYIFYLFQGYAWNPSMLGTSQQKAANWSPPSNFQHAHRLPKTSVYKIDDKSQRHHCYDAEQRTQLGMFSRGMRMWVLSLLLPIQLERQRMKMNSRDATNVTDFSLIEYRTRV